MERLHIVRVKRKDSKVKALAQPLWRIPAQSNPGQESNKGVNKGWNKGDSQPTFPFEDYAKERSSKRPFSSTY